MLSSAKIGRSSWRYYQRTVAGGACEYYAQHGDTPGRWHGSGLTQLGLTAGAEVQERELEALFGRALSPTTGAALGSPWRSDAVTGYDLTFSAPKSVSTLWALGDARTMTEIDAAHAAAVNAALGYLETHASLSRRGRDGVEQIESAGFAAACFDHRTSRTGDPQLHTHALVANKVRCTDGAWRTLDGHEIFHHKKSAGVIYQTALRAELSARLPVAFGPVSEHGQAEIAGVPEQLLTAWSSRTSAVMADAIPTIADAEDALGRPVSGAERARIIKTAVLSTRPAKDAPVPDGDRHARWVAQAAELGFAADAVTDSIQAANAQARALPVPSGWSGTVLRESVTEVGRRKAIWSRADLAVAVAARVPTTADPRLRSAADAVAWVEELTDLAVTEVGLSGAVALGADPSGVTARASDSRYASRELVETEARILERAVTGGFRSPERLRPDFVALLLSGEAGLSQEQGRAVVRLVATRDLVTVMTAPAGAGKTTTLAAATVVWGNDWKDVTALAPSARAAAELAKATGAPGQTVARWLLQEATHPTPVKVPSDPGYLRREVIVVDEASMLTTADLDALTAYVAKHRARLVLVGDPGQIGAVNAPGGMFEHLIHKLGGQVIELTELHRFTHPWEAAATLRLRAGDPGVLATYAERGKVHPAASSEDAADAVFDRWHTATITGRDALMLARAWTDVNALNARARAVAIATGAVTGPDLAVIATRSASTRGQVEQRSWRAGDVLLAKKNDSRTRIGGETLRNGDRFRVLAADDTGGLVVSDLRGRGTLTLLNAYLARHAEYGWAATIDGAQGATADVGIVLARAGLDREHLYVAMSRGRLENHVHTTPELATGDAGPHHHVAAPSGTKAGTWPGSRPYPGPLAIGLAVDPTDPWPGRRQGVQSQGDAMTSSSPGVQLALPDLDTALAMLARAVATSGRERAAHALLDPAVHAAREATWAREEAARPRPAIPREHQRNRDALAGARARRDRAADDVTRVRAELESRRAELERVPFWARKRRTTAEAAVRRSEGDLDRALTHLGSHDATVTGLAAVVDADTSQRDSDETQARRRRRQEWATWDSRDVKDPNAYTGPDDPRLHPTQPARAQEPFTVHHSSPHHSHSRGYGRDHGISR
ncbi:MAG: MobF family relaxase [Candidatus Nanopelagicales bacterium]